MKTDDGDWTDAEQRALRALAQGPEPPARLEDATVRRLAGEGAFRPQSPSPARGPWLPRLLAAAAGVALFALGLSVGSGSGSSRIVAPRPPSAPASDALPRFVLLLYDAPDEASLNERQMDERVAEYRDWARGVRAGGREISGEKLKPESAVLGPPEASGGGGGGGWPLGGYFVISARDFDAAVAVAQTCPHVRHGGRVEVRAIART